MKPSDVLTLLALGALWGGSYLFMHVGAAGFGPWTLAGLRAAVAAVCLLPLLLAGGRWRELAANWKPVAVAGIAGAALPYVLYAFATQHISTGLTATLSAATPLYAAAIAALWLRERLSAPRFAGLLLGLAGVVWLVRDRIDAGTGGLAALAIGAALLATLGYGFTGNFSRRHLSGVAPLVAAAGGQAASALTLSVPAVLHWPAASPSLRAWAALIALALLCTALAYLLFFRLIARIGAARTMTVSFLIPLFGVFWGWLFLGERIDADMLVGGAIILAGTTLSSGLADGAFARLRAREMAAS
ncbi:MAG TPA: DMT family transporter [Tahibacter sp.]|uniref:DMT family transporter n=1 Tax=Tahibacter sp. TaxID=2056211 RepID=UPI002D061376|nr:DMT family transporter [Tahibacter sp.]HSX61030.1 DMT family transporter [Tahibacter sp.]